MIILIFGGYPRSTTRIALLLAARITTHFPRLKTETIVYLSHKPEWGYFPCTPNEFNAMKNSARSNGRLVTMPGEVSVRFMALFSPFDHAQGPDCGGKVGQVA